MASELNSPFPTRLVLEGVPKIGYHLHLCPFPGSLFACMQYLGDPYDYDFLMGVTGAAFRRIYNRDDGGNVDLMHLSPEPQRRAFEAMGYTFRTVGNQDRAAMVQGIKESLAQGRPVLAFGIIGPPECGLVTGYDRDGATLYGFSYFQESSLPGYYEQDDWFQQMSRANDIGLILIGDRTPGKPSMRDILRASLEWAVRMARTSQLPTLPGHACGLAAYAAWADGMVVDADYPPEDPTALATRVMIHGDQAVMLEERRNGANYLRKMLDFAPETTAALKPAAALYQEVAELCGKIWLWGASMGPEVGQALIDPATRREIAQSIRLAAEMEAQAVACLEQALEAIKR